MSASGRRRAPPSGPSTPCPGAARTRPWCSSGSRDQGSRWARVSNASGGPTRTAAKGRARSADPRHRAAPPPGSVGRGPRPGPVPVGNRSRPAGLLPAAVGEVVALRHQDLAPEDAHHGAVLLVADRLDVYDPAVVPARALPLGAHRGLAVEGV